MNKDEAKEQLKSLIDDRNSFINAAENNDENIFVKDKEALETILLELNKQDRIIDKMALKIAKLNGDDQYCTRSGKNKICPHEIPTEQKCKECIKKYYEKKEGKINGNNKSK